MTFAHRLQDVQEKIEKASQRRPQANVKIVAISKTQSVEAIQLAYNQGIRNFGENYVQEALPKIEALPRDIQWHYVGNLQTNKMNKIVPHIQWVHSISQLSQVQKLEKLRQEGMKLPNILIQLNLAGESTKMGLQDPHIRQNLEFISEQTELEVCGLMTFPPYQDNPEKNRRYFAEMMQWKETIQGWKLPRVNIQELSMGVSGDFEVAIEEGATMIRLGEVLFGPRTNP